MDEYRAYLSTFSRANRSAAVSAKPRVLVVDDVDDIMLMLGKLVERMGYEVEMASCAAGALEIMERVDVDLVITDWSMPGMSGGELISTLRRNPRWNDIPTIVLTGHDTDCERTEAFQAGCDRFLVKPVKRDELECAITDLLDSEGRRDTIAAKSVEAIRGYPLASLELF